MNDSRLQYESIHTNSITDYNDFETDQRHYNQNLAYKFSLNFAYLLDWKNDEFSELSSVCIGSDERKSFMESAYSAPTPCVTKFELLGPSVGFSYDSRVFDDKPKPMPTTLHFDSLDEAHDSDEFIALCDELDALINEECKRLVDGSNGKILGVMSARHYEDYHLDKDNSSKGGPAKYVRSAPHCHYVFFSRSRLEHAGVYDLICELRGLKDKKDRDIEDVRTCKDSVRYLLHRTPKALDARRGRMKHQYDEDILFMHGETINSYEQMASATLWEIDYYRGPAGDGLMETYYTKDGEPSSREFTRGNADGQLRDLFNLYLNEKITRYDVEVYLLEYCGKQHVDRLLKRLNSPEYINQLLNIRAEEQQRRLDMGRDARSILFIHGESSTGKSYLANRLAHAYDGHAPYFGAPGDKGKTSDRYDSYCGERVVVNDEFSSDEMAYSAIRDFYDKTKPAKASSRYSNKKVPADLFIQTTSTDPAYFADGILLYHKGGSAYADPMNPDRLNDLPKTIKRRAETIKRMDNIIVLNHLEGDMYEARLFVFCEAPTHEDWCHREVFSCKYRNATGKAPEFKDEDIKKMLGYLTVGMFEDGKRAEIIRDSIKNNTTQLESYLKDIGYDMRPTNMNIDCVMSAYFDEFLPEFQWSGLPFTFLYDLYKAFIDDAFPNLENKHKLSKYKFNQYVREYAENHPETGLRVPANDQYRFNSKGRMDEDEPLISDYRLSGFMCYGQTFEEQRNFTRQESYTGLLLEKPEDARKEKVNDDE